MLTPGIDRRQRVAVCERGELIAPSGHEWIGDDDKCVGPPLGEGGEGRGDFGCGTGIDNVQLLPDVRAASSSSRNRSATSGNLVFTSAATVIAWGTSSCSNPSRFASSSLTKKKTPVTLPPGRLRLATRPSFTGSVPLPKTIGIVVVAALAATAARLLQTMTAT